MATDQCALQIPSSRLLSSVCCHNFSREPARSRTNAPHRIERLPEDHFRFRPADLARRKFIVFVVSRRISTRIATIAKSSRLRSPRERNIFLTYERKGVGSPRWSPNGDRLAFVAAEGAAKDAKPQIFILSMTGGEARKITDTPNGIEQFAWRPNGQEIAYVTSDEPRTRRKSKTSRRL